MAITIHGRMFAAGAVLLAAGCSSVPPPNQEIGAARQAVSQAEAAEAAQYAPAELRHARTKLSDAESAARAEENERAGRLAEQALVDARLAEAQSQHVRNRQVLAESRRSLETLQRELNAPGGQPQMPGANGFAPRSQMQAPAVRPVPRGPGAPPS